MTEENNRYREEEKENEVKEEKVEEAPAQEEIKEEAKETEQKDKKAEKKEKKDQVTALNEQIKELNKQIADLKNEVLKTKADEVNFKKRIEEDKAKTVEYANQKVLEKFINHIDLFDKVVSSPVEDPVLKNYLIGFEMINNNFKQVLEEEGVKKIVVKVGDKMDPKFHHALQTAWDENYDEDVILQELQSGYTYKDRILRPTLVKVNKKEGK